MSTVRCGNRKVHGKDSAHHKSVAQVRLCFARPLGLHSLEDEEQEAMVEQEVDPDLAYERHLEDRGWAEAAAERDWEDARGVIQFEDAMAAAAAEYVEPGTLLTAQVPDDGKAHTLYVGQAPAPTQGVIYDGIYTIEHEDGTHRTFRLRTQKADDKFKPGVQIVGVLAGPDNETDYVGVGHLEGRLLHVWAKHRKNQALVADAKALVSHPEGALKAAHCFRCGRTLTVPTSTYAGMGPECRKK